MTKINNKFDSPRMEFVKTCRSVKKIYKVDHGLRKRAVLFFWSQIVFSLEAARKLVIGK